MIESVLYWIVVIGVFIICLGLTFLIVGGSILSVLMFFTERAERRKQEEMEAHYDDPNNIPF